MSLTATATATTATTSTTSTRPGGTEHTMFTELEVARLRHGDLLRSAERTALRRKLAAARRWDRRAREAGRRARLAAQAIR